MNARSFYLAATVLAAAVFALLAYVEFRNRTPEWKGFQEKGVRLALESLNAKLSSEPSSEDRDRLVVEIRSLQARSLEIIEIQPFAGKLPAERCLTCHFGIEDVSASHPNAIFGCVICHGGNGADLTVKGAHIGLRGGSNPSALDIAPVSCGSTRLGADSCHSDRKHPFLNRADNVPKSIMATNAGIIGILRFQWGVEESGESRFAVKNVHDSHTRLNRIDSEISDKGVFNLPESHFRKFCASCHLWTARPREQMGRLEGCAACHARYGPEGRYIGGDPTIKRNEPGHPATHQITNKISDDQCRACHNRSARIGLSYHGEMESSQYGTPFVKGGLNNTGLSDGRFVWNLVPDIHREKGMACIDCHSGQDTMGDGTVYRFMKDQVEVRCEDCHGSASEPPRTTVVDEADALVRGLAKSSQYIKIRQGERIALTSKGRPMPHVKVYDDGLRLTDKLTGKEHKINVITGKKGAHSIPGHNRLECDSCHSAWSPQCYGCHQSADLDAEGKDHISGKMTPGRWVEGRNYFRYERNIFGINSRGKVGILVPGCQVWNTVTKNGKIVDSYDSAIMQLKNGNNSIAAASTHPHTTRKETPRCIDCHLDSKALGLGEGILKLNPSNNGLKVESPHSAHSGSPGITFPLDAVVDANGDVLQGTSHKLARGFNREELTRIISIAPCLPCHDRYEDPIWSKSGPYVPGPKCPVAGGDAK